MQEMREMGSKEMSPEKWERKIEPREIFLSANA